MQEQPETPGIARPVEKSSSVSATATPAQSEDAPSRRNRRSYSLNDENYDMVWREARRRGFFENTTLNLMLEELREWRNGTRKFVERRRQPR